MRRSEGSVCISGEFAQVLRVPANAHVVVHTERDTILMEDIFTLVLSERRWDYEHEYQVQ
jgi:hypothetical protein